ncbi:MAG: hypothetical protein WC256_12365 [Desulfurivibrionaceae bacterium]|jgi:hypothetical protein
MKQRNVVKTITVAVVLMLMAMLVGCFGGGPSNSEIEKAVLTELNGDGAADQLRSVINFNIIEKTKTDDSHYLVKASYDYQFKMSFEDFRSGVIAEVRNAKGAEKLDAVMTVTEIKDIYGEFKKDDLYHQEIEIVFAKTDKGWKMANTAD